MYAFYFFKSIYMLPFCPNSIPKTLQHENGIWCFLDKKFLNIFCKVIES